MRVPLSWLREFVDVPPDVAARDVAHELIRAGLEVETVVAVGAGIEGPVVIGRVLEIDEFEASNGKTIRYCQVDVGEAAPRGIVCGARNFVVGDAVVVSLPGATLPGGFAIGARKTYGHVSDGMICSARELGFGDDHTGIVVLDATEPVGADAVAALGLRDDVLDIAVTPDRGDCLSIRGVAREAAIAYGLAFHDPAEVVMAPLPATSRPIALDDPTGCDRFVLHEVTGFDPGARSPFAIRLRLAMSDVRPISLAVDVTNYVMLELGQPLHAYDATKLQGGIGVRRAGAGERLETLDHTVRDLDHDDLLIVDDSGPIGLAGTMGGLSTEIDDATGNLLIEAAHFAPVAVARMSRRHRLSSEASRRFERGVDPELPPRAAARAAALLVEFGGGRVSGGTEADLQRPPTTIVVAADHPDRVAGTNYGRAAVVARLEQVGCSVEGSDADGGALLRVVPPSWRPDLVDPNDLAEEVIRLEGYDAVPARLPTVSHVGGLTEEQRRRRLIGRTLADAGYVEVLAYPFLAPEMFDALTLDDADPRRRALHVANPLSDEEPLLRTTVLPGLLAAARRNLSRGSSDVALFEMGPVYLSGHGAAPPPRLGVDRRPTDAELAQLLAALPDQPLHVGVVLAGERERAGWWGPGRSAGWADAVEAVRRIASVLGVEVAIGRGGVAPWHPGRCAEARVNGVLIGHAGELHPRVLAALDLPPRTCAAEADLSALLASTGGPVQAAPISTYPVATQDVAVVVPTDVAAADVEAALRAGAGELLESIRLFDVYVGDQLGPDRKSLAYALRFRAPDRTLTADEASAAREAAVAEAGRRVGALLRG